VSEVGAAVTACGEAAHAGAGALASAPAGVIDEALRGMAALLTQAKGPLLAANAADVAAGQRAGLGAGLLDRLRLDEDRIADLARQIGLLAAVPFPPGEVPVRDLPGGLRLAERRVPVGVIGANYEARPNVTVDVASQLLKSRNAGVLRTGGAALRSAAALFDHVIVPAVTAAGLDTSGISPGRGHRTGPPARADPAGDPARQRCHHPRARRGGGQARGPHPRARRRRRGAVPGRGR